MSRTLLVVDDSKTERVVLRGFLKSEYDLIEAESGEEAIEILQAKYKTISAIVLDVIMPGMDGFETLKVIKANTLWLPIPVIITTGLDDDASREKAIACGADNFVTKPFNQKLLMHIVQNVIKLRETAALANTLYRDNMTGLLNRESFYTEAARMIKRKPDGFFMLSSFDIENFKVINDQHGTEVGDEVLRHIAGVLSTFAAGNGGLACRYMGDKFTVLFPARLLENGGTIKYYRMMTTPPCLTRPIHIRVGRYAVVDRELPVSSMYDRASMAESSIKGRIDVYYAEYTEKMREELLREQEIVNEMGTALAGGEFEPWFQPQYNHATGALIGAEALVRWRRNGKVIPPSDFIPVFEKNGFIYEVDQSIWQQVCSMLRQWLNEGRSPMPISVNISRYDLYQPDFMDTLCGLVKEYELPIELLRLEITESAFSDSTSIITNMAEALIAKGFTVEIDDFGSGYSSLNTLKDVPATILKLDMRFFEATKNSERGGNIVESVVRMAKWLGMAIIAEGVEDKAQADYLKSIGCYYIQGYFYSRPIPAAEYEKLLESGKKEQKLSQLITLETLDNNEFWNPKSMETLIFNSYVGGACIFEFAHGKTELLRINDQYISELHGIIPAGATLKDCNIFHLFSDESKKDFLQMLQTASQQSKEASCEARMTRGEQTEYIRFTTRVIARTDERLLYYGVLVNLTEQRMAEYSAIAASEQNAAILDNSQCGITAVILHKNGKMESLFANNRFYEILGYTKEQFRQEIGDAFKCIVPEDRERVFRGVIELDQIGQMISQTLRVTRRDGSIAWIRKDTSIVKFEGIRYPIQLSSYIDITEQVEAEQERLESAERLRIIMSNINGSVSAFTMDDVGNTQLIFGNDKYYEIFGYSRAQAEAVQLDTMSCIVPEDFTMAVDMLRQLKRDGVPIDLDYRAQKRDGSLIYVRAICSRMSMEGYGDEVIVSVETDITEQRTLQDQLSAVVENINGGVSATYLNNNKPEYVVVNDKYYEIIGYTKEQFAAEVETVFDLIHPDDRERVEKLVKEAAKTETPYTMEYRIIRRNGAVRHILCNVNIMHLFGIDAPVQLAVSNDVTVLRNVQQKEAETADKLRAVMNAMQNGVTAVAFRGDHTEFLFANERYYELHGITRDEYAQREIADSLIPVHPDDRELLRELVLGSTEIGQTGSAEYRILRPDGTVRWAEVSISVTRISGLDVPVQVAIFSDINAEKEAAQQLRFLNEAAGGILAQPEIEAAIDETLQKTNDYFHADRSYVVELDEKRKVTNNTYEVCAEGIPPQKDNLQALKFMPSDSWFDTLSRGDYMVIDDVDAMEDDQAGLRDVLLAQDIHSIIIVALRRDGKLLGFVGVDNPSSAVEQVSQLTALAVYIAVLLTRRDLKRSCDHERESIQLLMDDTPGGFCRMRIFPGKSPTLVNMNSGFCQMLGMTKDEVFSVYGEDIHGLLNTEDFADRPADIADATRSGGQFSTKCRLRKKDSTLLWVMVFGRFVNDENGELYLNAYFTDITAEKTAEQHQIELLDNLPTGAALYEYDGKALTAIHINKSYWKLVKRESTIGSIMDAIHPDDRLAIHQEIESAISQKRCAEANCRILCGDGSYQAFHVLGSITPMDNGHWTLCLSYASISDETMSIQEMLPIALSTMVASTDDMSYVKDKNLRYICVSRSIAKMAGIENPRDFIGRTAEEVFAKTIAGKFNEDDRHVLEIGRSVLNKLEHLPTADGSVCLARTSKFPILDSRGNAIGVYCVSRDITAQKEKESQLDLLTSSIPGGLAAYSITGEGFTTLYFNDGYYAYSGYTREEYMAMTAAEPLALILPEDRQKMLEMIHEFAGQKEDGLMGACTYRCRTKNGDIRWMSMKAVLSQVGEDAFILNAVQLDVTDQMEASSRIKQLLDNLPFGAALYRFDGTELTAVHINKQYALMVNSRVNPTLENFRPMDAIHPDDRQAVMDEVKAAVKEGRSGVCEARLLYGDEEYRSFRMDANIARSEDGTYLLFVAYTPVTDKEKEERERRRLAEEEYRLAIAHAGRTICRYNIAAQTITMSYDAAQRLGLPEVLTDVPYGRVKLGKISKETADAYIAFFESIMRGEKDCSATYLKLLNIGWRWVDARATTIFDDAGKPVSAIISYTDVTEQREKEAIYSRWQNSLAERDPNSYTMFRCNLSKSSSYESWEGDLLKLYFKEGTQTFDERTDEFVEQCVYAEDRARYRAFMRADTMLAAYYRGHRSDSMEFRQLENGTIRWLRLSVDLVEYKDSSDVEAYLMYENIDDRKRLELKTIERAETDPLTGVLNRVTFAVRVNQLISQSRPGSHHALLMLDIDNFKQVNDIFGHGAGDQVLTDIADLLTRSSRKDDIVGRLGGDEFVVFLSDIPDETTAARKARQICELTRRNFSIDVQISASIGVAVYPADGEGFESLYKSADEALYRVKDSGKNGYAMSTGEPVLDADSPRHPGTAADALASRRNLCRILIVDDSKTDLEMLSAIFKGEYRIEKATNGATALTKLRHYGTAISVVLLDLMMPGMDGFEVLRKMQQEESIRTVPVIVVSADEQRETALRVIRAGASDLVAKPVDPDILRLRVESAISRAENERLRAQNSYLAMRSTEINSYRSAMERSGIMVITLDWGKNEFTYSPSVSNRLAGTYDGRRLWSVLLSEMVTDTLTVQQMQRLVHEIAEDRERMDGNMTVRLKTAEGVSRLFEMDVFKETNDIGLADKLLLTLRETQTQTDGGESK